MENKKNHNKMDTVKPVSRKTNEEIDEDDKGKLIIGGVKERAKNKTIVKRSSITNKGIED